MDEDSHWPALRGLDGKEGEEGGGHVVVVELLSRPLADQHRGRVVRVGAEPEELALTRLSIFHANVAAEEELSIEQLDTNHSKDEVEEDVDYEDVEDVLERVDDTVKDCLQLGHSLDGLEGPEHSEHPEALHHSEVLRPRAPPARRP